jgi:hypothetical protein
VAVLEQLPEQAPMDQVIASRELFRGKVLTGHLLVFGSGALMLLVLTWSASSDSLSVDVNYWLLAIGGLLAGTALTALVTRDRTHSSLRQQTSVEKAWRRARVEAIPSAKRRWKLVGTIIGILIAGAAFLIAAIQVVGLSHLNAIVVPLIGLSGGVELSRLLRSFRWATWFGRGAIDPDVAGELARSMIQASKVQYYAEVYAQSHPTIDDESA